MHRHSILTSLPLTKSYAIVSLPHARRARKREHGELGKMTSSCTSMMEAPGKLVFRAFSDDDARHERDDDHPYRTERCPFNSLVRLGVRNRSGATPPAARGYS